MIEFFKKLFSKTDDTGLDCPCEFAGCGLCCDCPVCKADNKAKNK